MPATLTRWRDAVFAPFDGGLFPFVAPEIRIEQTVADKRFVVRAEVPGVDPRTGIDLTVVDDVLRIRAERTEAKHEPAHSEFRYGTLLRTVLLPADVVADTATATYDHGILEVSFELGQPAENTRHITVKVAKEVGDRTKK